MSCLAKRILSRNTLLLTQAHFRRVKPKKSAQQLAAQKEAMLAQIPEEQRKSISDDLLNQSLDMGMVSNNLLNFCRYSRSCISYCLIFLNIFWLVRMALLQICYSCLAWNCCITFCSFILLSFDFKSFSPLIWTFPPWIQIVSISKPLAVVKGMLGVVLPQYLNFAWWEKTSWESTMCICPSHHETRAGHVVSANHVIEFSHFSFLTLHLGKIKIEKAIKICYWQSAICHSWWSAVQEGECYSLKAEFIRCKDGTRVFETKQAILYSLDDCFQCAVHCRWSMLVYSQMQQTTTSLEWRSTVMMRQSLVVYLTMSGLLK